MATPVSSTVVEEYVRCSTAILNMLVTITSENNEFRAELDAVRESMAASSAQHDSKLAAILAAMPSSRNEEPSLREEVQQLRAGFDKLHNEYSRLSSEVSKLQVASNGSKDAIKGLNVAVNKHMNELNSHRSQLERMETQVAHLEVEKTYFESTTVMQHPAADKTQHTSDPDSARSPSMTLQGSPMWPNVQTHPTAHANPADDSDISSNDASFTDALTGTNERVKRTPLESFKSGAMCGRVEQGPVITTSEAPLDKSSEGSPLSEVLADEIMDDPHAKLAGDMHDEDPVMAPLGLPSQSLPPITIGDKSDKANGKKKGVARKIVKETQSTQDAHSEVSEKDGNNLLTSDIVVAARGKSGKRPYYTGYKSQPAVAPGQPSTAQADPNEASAHPEKISPASQAEQAPSTQSTKRQSTEIEDEVTAQPDTKRPKRKVKTREAQGMKSWREVPARDLRR